MWLEAITVRTATLDHLEQQIPHLLQQLSVDSPDVEVSAYTRYPTNRDLSFHLIHGDTPCSATCEGVRLADALRAFGSVDHAIWQSIPRTSNPVDQESSK